MAGNLPFTKSQRSEVTSRYKFTASMGPESTEMTAEKEHSSVMVTEEAMAEAASWGHHLRCWIGDIVLDLLHWLWDRIRGLTGL